MYHFTIALERYQYMHITYAQTFEEDNHFFRKLLSAKLFINEISIQTINCYLQ